MKSIQRSQSEVVPPSGGTANPTRELWSRIRRKQSKVTHRDHRTNFFHADKDSQDSFNLQPTNSNTLAVADPSDSNYRQLASIVVKMRAAPSGPNHVDAAYKEFTKLQDRATPLCYAIIEEEIKSSRKQSLACTREGQFRRESANDPPASPLALSDQRSSFSGGSLTEAMTKEVTRSTAYTSDSWLNAIRDWKNCVEVLADTLKQNLTETYKSYERDATPEMLEHLFNNKRFRREAVNRMRNASVTRVLSADPQFFPRYEIRFRDYERVKEDLRELRNLLQAAESGISPDRRIFEVPISRKGDAILEYANLGPEAASDDPVLRFRVSSSMLADTSPIFAKMFGGHAVCHDDDDIANQTPPPPARYICQDGQETKLFRMPQHELNQHESLEILLHAAHMHYDKLPPEVSFEQFVALAECSMRYKSTLPLEQVVEHRWLPQWMRDGADAMPDGLLVISYAFGLRELFTRMSKIVLFTLVDERDLIAKRWPKRIRDSIWAMRNAKIDQVYACCTSTIQEYIKPPAPVADPQKPEDFVPPDFPANDFGGNLATFAPSHASTILTATPRCPKGSHWCDSSNLGWMMLVFNEMGVLAHMLAPSLTAHIPPEAARPQRSLAQLFEALRKIPNPTAPIHRGGVCDPGSAFKHALNDVLDSVTGLTLYDVSGKSHGWGLSKHECNKPQTRQKAGLDRMAQKDPEHSVATEFPERVRLNVLSQIDNLDDLQAAAMINWAYYETYKTHELYLMRNILRVDRMRGNSLRRPVPAGNRNAEEKFLKAESDLLRAGASRLAADAMTLRSELDDEDVYHSDDDTSVDEGPVPSTSDWRDAPHAINERVVGRSVAPRPNSTTENISSVTFTSRQTPAPQIQGDGSRAAGRSEPAFAETAEEEVPMTDEEARRILWPDEDYDSLPSSKTAPTSSAPTIPRDQDPGNVVREKFLMGDPFLAEGLEAKTLVVHGQTPLGRKPVETAREREGSAS